MTRLRLTMAAWPALLFLAAVFAAPLASAQTASDDDSSRGTITTGNTVLHVNDVVKITVFGEDDLTTETRIEKDGSIRFPLLGSVSLAGKTVGQATDDIRSLLGKKYIRNPQVTLSVSSYARQLATILGEVKRPGKIEFPDQNGLDLLGAVALAGGFTDIAETAHITVRRVVNGKDTILEVNAKKLAHDSTVKPFYVLPGDTITVRQRIF